MCQVGYLPELYKDARSEKYVEKKERIKGPLTFAEIMLVADVLSVVNGIKCEIACCERI